MKVSKYLVERISDVGKSCTMLAECSEYEAEYLVGAVAENDIRGLDVEDTV